VRALLRGRYDHEGRLRQPQVHVIAPPGYPPGRTPRARPSLRFLYLWTDDYAGPYPRPRTLREPSLVALARHVYFIIMLRVKSYTQYTRPKVSGTQLERLREELGGRRDTDGFMRFISRRASREPGEPREPPRGRKSRRRHVGNERKRESTPLDIFSGR